MKKYFLVTIIGLSVLTACKKDNEDPIPVTPAENSILLNLGHEVDGQSLLFDTLIYTNDAGSQYGVSRLWYYLSQVSLIRPDSSTLLIKNYQFIDAATSSTNQMLVSGIPAGTYIGLKFNIGLDSAQNITGGLPITVENLNMEWPVQMGGGYHFMKFEGHASDTAGDYGFAMHLGLNAYLVSCVAYGEIQITSGEKEVNMVMNLNEWFRNPDVYDFNVDGNYSMGVMSAMVKLKQNGADVFSIQ